MRYIGAYPLIEASRLAGEPLDGVADIHVHPGESGASGYRFRTTSEAIVARRIQAQRLLVSATVANPAAEPQIIYEELR